MRGKAPSVFSPAALGAATGRPSRDHRTILNAILSHYLATLTLAAVLLWV
jgi:hypothetical protein